MGNGVRPHIPIVQLPNAFDGRFGGEFGPGAASRPEGFIAELPGFLLRASGVRCRPQPIVLSCRALAAARDADLHDCRRSAGASGRKGPITPYCRYAVRTTGTEGHKTVSRLRRRRYRRSIDRRRARRWPVVRQSAALVSSIVRSTRSSLTCASRTREMKAAPDTPPISLR